MIYFHYFPPLPQGEDRTLLTVRSFAPGPRCTVATLTWAGSSASLSLICFCPLWSSSTLPDHILPSLIIFCLSWPSSALPGHLLFTLITSCPPCPSCPPRPLMDKVTSLSSQDYGDTSPSNFPFPQRGGSSFQPVFILVTFMSPPYISEVTPCVNWACFIITHFPLYSHLPLRHRPLSRWLSDVLFTILWCRKNSPKGRWHLHEGCFNKRH